MRLGLGFCLLGDMQAEAFGHHAKAIAEAVTTPGVDEVKLITTHNLCPYDRARDAATVAALEAGVDVLWFIDADTLVPVGALAKLLPLLQRGPIVSGHYYRRGHPYTSVWSVATADTDVWHQVTAQTGVFEVDSVGLRCTLVDLRWMCLNVQQPWWKCWTGMTEDVQLCKKVREAGGKVIACADVRCGHLEGRKAVTDENVAKLQRWALDEQTATTALEVSNAKR